LAATAGAAIGYGYARFNLPPELLTTKQTITGGYALAGAAAGILTLRLAIICRRMREDYRRGN
jgi:hypothetical protein